MTVPDYVALIDWTNTGNYSGTGADVSDKLRGGTGVRVQRGRDQARSYSPPFAGRLDADLDNTNGDYSTENSGSPLAGYLYPGHLTTLRAGYGTVTYNEASMQYNTAGIPYDGSSYALYTGYLNDLVQKPDRDKKSVGIPALGPLSKLIGKPVTTPLYTSVRTDVALGYILDAVGFSSTARKLSQGATTFDWWWADNQDAFEAAQAILNSEGPGAALYDDGMGNIVFEGTNYRAATNRSIYPQSTIRAQGTEPLLSPPFSYAPRQQDIINIAQMTQKVRSAKAISDAWSLGATLTFTASETKVIVARTANSDPMTGALTPVAVTDYTVGAGTITSVSINRTSGGNIQITMTAGVGGATVTGLKMRAQVVSVDNTTDVTTTVDNTTSITRYGRRSISVGARSEMPFATAQTLINQIVTTFQIPQPVISVRLVSQNAQRLETSLRRQISDRMTVIVGDSLGWTYNEASKQYNQVGVPYDANYYSFNSDVFVETITHEVLANQQVHVTTFGCSKAAAQTTGLWDIGLWGTARWGF